jgi:hypothetical protein
MENNPEKFACSANISHMICYVNIHFMRNLLNKINTFHCRLPSGINVAIYSVSNKPITERRLCTSL